MSVIEIFDTDSHVTEPEDLFTSRVDKRWGEQVPHVVYDETRSERRWLIGGVLDMPVAMLTPAGWPEPWPSHPPTLAETDQGSYDANERLRRMDEYGVKAQVVYPNLLAFSTHKFMALEPELALACVRAYNDFQCEFASADPHRLIPITALPFWDIEASIAEMGRCERAGHRGILLGALFEQVGLPNIDAPRWNPLLEAAQALELSVNMHVAFAGSTSPTLEDPTKSIEAVLDHDDPVNFAEKSVHGLLSNARAISCITMRGVCHRYPRLKFVSVESGAGYLPYLLQAMDWQFENTGAQRAHADWGMPSEYFRRQVYGTFWFEQVTTDVLVDLQDNLMFETDFPHPTSLTPGPSSSSLTPAEMVRHNLGKVTPDVLSKLIYDNAAHLYHMS